MAEQSRLIGFVAKMFPKRGIAYVRTDDGSSFFFHQKNVRRQSKDVAEGVLVGFTPVYLRNYCPPKINHRAVDVEVL